MASPDLCEGCSERPADPRETWHVTYTRGHKLCKRCARLLAKRFKAWMLATCRPPAVSA
jgi:hypothetical protein